MGLVLLQAADLPDLLAVDLPTDSDLLVLVVHLMDQADLVVLLLVASVALLVRPASLPARPAVSSAVIVMESTIPGSKGRISLPVN